MLIFELRVLSRKLVLISPVFLIVKNYRYCKIYNIFWDQVGNFINFPDDLSIVSLIRMRLCHCHKNIFD